MDYEHELYHYGILGMKWGIRRYQNPDGTLTAEGRKRYGVGSSFSRNAVSNVFDSAKNYGYDDDHLLKEFRKRLPKYRIDEIDKKAEEAYDSSLDDFLEAYDKFDSLEKDREFGKEIESSIRKMSPNEMKNVIVEYYTGGGKLRDLTVEDAFYDLVENTSYKHFVENSEKYIPQKNKEKHDRLNREIDRIAEELAKDYVLEFGDTPIPNKAKRGINYEANMVSDIIRNAARYNGILDFWEAPIYSKDFIREDLYYYFADRDHQYLPPVSYEFKNEIIKKLEQIPELKR